MFERYPTSGRKRLSRLISPNVNSAIRDFFSYGWWWWSFLSFSSLSLLFYRSLIDSRKTSTCSTNGSLSERLLQCELLSILKRDTLQLFTSDPPSALDFSFRIETETWKEFCLVFRSFFPSNIMSYLHLPSAANSSSPSSSSSSSTAPSSYLHVSSNGGVSTVPSSSIGSNSSSSLLGSIGAGKQWTTIGQPSSSSTLTQQLLMKQSHLLNGPQLASSHFDSIIGSVMGSSSQSAMEKNVIDSPLFFSFSPVSSSLVRNKARRFPTVAPSK